MDGKLFTKALMDKLKALTTIYFEKADSGVVLPYAVIQSITFSGNVTYEVATIEIAVYQKDGATLSVETISKAIKDGLHGTQLRVSGQFSSHIYFETSDNLRDPDSDIISRRMTFTARIFYI